MIALAKRSGEGIPDSAKMVLILGGRLRGAGSGALMAVGSISRNVGMYRRSIPPADSVGSQKTGY